MIGQTISHYEILSLLGEGGMGRVYKARDKALNRFVALKVLPPDKVADAERKRRFVQEAQAASALNHPNIVTIYDIGTERGVDFIVMEFIPGKVLSALIPPKGQKLSAALQCAVQVADALAAAHAAGIVHRDLKPGNVMVSEEGRVKVLDFGLAKLAETSVGGADDETQTLRQETEQGTILGTAAYMSPEQAEGRKVDARSDIFSFGVMLYEMVTGRRPFTGDSKLSLLASILRAEVKAPSAVVDGLPREVERIVLRCLKKDLSRRYQVMADVRVALREVSEELESGRLEAPVAALPERRMSNWVWPAVAVLGVGAGLASWWARPAAAPVEVWRTRRLTADAALTTTPSISRDGKLVAYASDRAGAGNLDLYVQQASGGRPLRLTEHPNDDYDPSFSPDSAQIAFRSERDGGGIYMIPALGGEARLLAPGGTNPRFSPDGKTVAYQVGAGLRSSEIFLVPATGGKPTKLETGIAWAGYAIWSPDGANLLFQGSETSRFGDAWYTVAASGGKASKLRLDPSIVMGGILEGPNRIGANAWLPGGRLILSGFNSGLFTANLSLGSGTVGPMRNLTLGSGTDAWPSVDATGSRIAFAGRAANRDLWSMAIDGNIGKPLGDLQRMTEGPADSTYPTVSRDGRSLAYTSDRSGNWDVYLRDLESGKERALTSAPEVARRAEISPDGSHIVLSMGGAVSVIPARGGIPEKLCDGCAATVLGWSPDSRQVIVWEGKPISLFLLSMDRKRTPLLSHPKWDLHRGQFSPDGRWIAFNPRKDAINSGLAISPVRNGTAAGESEWVTVTNGENGDEHPMWSPDGNLLYFVTHRAGFNDLWAVRLDANTKRPVGEPFEVLPFHTARRSIVAAFGKAITKNRLFLPVLETKGNIWIAERAN
jgi:Tol biopolymer transport system component/tRNA A-37 threonylcarbamoyl transferase component Bud32